MCENKSLLNADMYLQIVCKALARYEGQIEYIHISDQYSGPKNQYE